MPLLRINWKIQKLLFTDIVIKFISLLLHTIQSAILIKKRFNNYTILFDFYIAKDYLERAVAKGHTGAMNNLASMYMSGKQGVERNFKKAYELYSSGKYSKRTLFRKM